MSCSSPCWVVRGRALRKPWAVVWGTHLCRDFCGAAKFSSLLDFAFPKPCTWHPAGPMLGGAGVGIAEAVGDRLGYLCLDYCFSAISDAAAMAAFRGLKVCGIPLLPALH